MEGYHGLGEDAEEVRENIFIKEAAEIATEQELASTVNAGHLKSYVERVERLEEEKSTFATDIKEVYGEAKANGFDTKIIKMIVKIRKQDREERQETEAILDLYLSALGMN